MQSLPAQSTGASIKEEVTLAIFQQWEGLRWDPLREKGMDTKEGGRNRVLDEEPKHLPSEWLCWKEEGGVRWE